MTIHDDRPNGFGFWELRTGWSWLKDNLLLEPLPGGSRWAAAFGSLLLFTFLLQVVTGILLAMNYAPSVGTAWSSVKFIQEDVPMGWFIRGLHHWGSSAMVILLLMHLVQVFVWGAYKRPREFTWMVGVLLLCCTLGLAFTGYLLPWDQKAYWATKVGLGIIGTAPFFGDALRGMLQGGPQIGNLTLTHFFSIHTFVIPIILIFLVVVHLYLFRLHGVTPPWWASAAELEAKEEPFWPGQVWKDALLALALLVVLGVWCAYRPAPLEEKANPALPYEARPEWYFMFLFQLLKYFEGPYEVVGTFVLPMVFFALLFFWPFLDRSPHRDPRRRPVAVALLSMGSVGLVGLTIFAIITDVRMREPALALKLERRVHAPAGPLQRLDVAKIYNTNCAACHGIDGSGQQIRKGMPTIPDLTSLAWQMSQTDLEITHRIEAGDEPLMPAYRDKLSREEILALGIYVRAFSVQLSGPAAAQEKPIVAEAVPKPAPAPAPQPVQPPREQVVAQMSSPQVYRAYCLACHDSDGRGQTVRSAMPEIPDFTDANWQEGRTDSDLQHVILEGKGKFMLPMKDKLGQVDVAQMAAYVRAFQGHQQIVALDPPKQPAPPFVDPTVIVPGPSEAASQPQPPQTQPQPSLPQPKPQPPEPKPQPPEPKPQPPEPKPQPPEPKPQPLQPKPQPPQPQLKPQPPQAPPPAVITSVDTSMRTSSATGLYRQYCLSCHGVDGKGNEMRAAMPSMPDLTRRDWQEAHSNAQFVVSILDGKGTLMPAFRGRITDDQAHDLVAFVRSFGPPVPKSVTPPQSDFERRFRQLKQQREELERQMKALPPPK